MADASTPAGQRARATADIRRQELVQAAYRRIAAGGFEGLRTRDVAQLAGVNVATLHYYFPTKEALIRGILDHALQRFIATFPRERSPGALAEHFQAISQLLKQEEQFFIVLAELALRAARDSVTAQLMRDMDSRWSHELSVLMRDGKEQGALPAALDVEGAVALALSAIKGLCMPADPAVRQDRIERTMDELQRAIGLVPTPARAAKHGKRRPAPG